MNGYLLFTKAGLKEFQILVDIVADLNPTCWKFRNQLFDNEELDELLPKLRVDVETLFSMQDQLKSVFSLDELPSVNELRQLKKSLQAGGIFRWFKKSWRSARKRVLAFTSEDGTKFSTMQKCLGKAAQYVNNRSQLEENQPYKDALGAHLKGLNTDLATLESLRQWYGKVRHQYGVGFGRRVAIGSAILELPAELVRGLCSLSDRGVLKQLNDWLDCIGKLDEIFTPDAHLQHSTKLLTGEQGVITILHATLEKALRVCSPLVTDSAFTIAELNDRIESLNSLNKAVTKWMSEDFNDNPFQGRVGLMTGLNVDNAASLSTIRNTIAIATCLDEQIENDKIRLRVYDQPTTETFNSLSNLSVQLCTALKTQVVNCKAFEQMARLEENSWVNQSGDQIYNIIARVNLALDNGDALQNWLNYARERHQVAKMGLNKLVEVVEQGDIEIQKVEDAHQAGVYDMLAREIFRLQPKLGQFSGRSQEAIQDKFASLTESVGDRR